MESMVKIIKKALKLIIRDRMFTDEALSTFVKWQVENRNFKIGELILISVENMHRLDCPLARMIKIRPSRDDVVRVLKVKTTNGEYVRPAGNLCLLEHSSFYNNSE